MKFETAKDLGEWLFNKKMGLFETPQFVVNGECVFNPNVTGLRHFIRVDKDHLKIGSMEDRTIPLTRDSMYRYATAQGFLHSRAYSVLDDFLESLEYLDPIQVGDLTFSMKETEWEAWFRENWIGTGVLEEAFMEKETKLRVEHIHKNHFKISLVIGKDPLGSTAYEWHSSPGLYVTPKETHIFQGTQIHMSNALYMQYEKAQAYLVKWLVLGCPAREPSGRLL